MCLLYVSKPTISRKSRIYHRITTNFFFKTMFIFYTIRRYFMVRPITSSKITLYTIYLLVYSNTLQILVSQKWMAQTK